MQALNLRREFKVFKMKDSKTIKEYIDKPFRVVNQIKMLGEELIKKGLAEKVLVSTLERFETKISSLKNSKDFTKLTQIELINALQV